MKALAAGKHVLLEKPAANTAEETRKMFELAETNGLVLLEAVHYRYSRTLSATITDLSLQVSSPRTPCQSHRREWRIGRREKHINLSISTSWNDQG
jgi:predicted dehydrogenase